MRWIRASLVLTLLFAVLDCTSQVQPVSVRVDAAGENNAVPLSSLDESSEADLAKFFRSPADRAFRPYSLLLKNNSGKPIVGLSLVWTVTTPENVRRCEDHFETINGGMPAAIFAPVPPTPEELAAQRAARSATMRGEAGPDAAAVNRHRVQVSRSGASFPFSLSPGASMVVAPNRFSFADGPVSGGAPAQLFSTALDLSVLVDAVVLTDGLVLGPDQSGTLDGLNARNAGFEALLSAVRTAREHGQDPIPVLEQLAEASHRSHDATARAEGMIANILLHSQDWEKQFKFMEETELVKYHR
jgi:hypothetical protein